MPKVTHYNTVYFLRYTHLWYMKCLFKNIQKQKNMLKSRLVFKKNTSFMVTIPWKFHFLKPKNRFKKAKFSGYCFYMEPSIQLNFQICISVPLIRKFLRKHYAKKWKLSLKSSKGWFFYQLLSPCVKIK